MTWPVLVALVWLGVIALASLAWYGWRREDRARRDAEAQAWAEWCAQRARRDAQRDMREWERNKWDAPATERFTRR